MRIAHCFFPDCTYKTPRMETEFGAVTLLLAHTNFHIFARMFPPPPPPVIIPRFLQNPLLIPSPRPMPPAPPLQMPVPSFPPNRKRRHVSTAPDSRRPLPFGHRKILEGIRRKLPATAQGLYSRVLETNPLSLSSNGSLPSTIHEDLHLS